MNEPNVRPARIQDLLEARREVRARRQAAAESVTRLDRHVKALGGGRARPPSSLPKGEPPDRALEKILAEVDAEVGRFPDMELGIRSNDQEIARLKTNELTIDVVLAAVAGIAVLWVVLKLV